ETAVLPLETTKSGIPTAGMDNAGILRNNDQPPDIVGRGKPQWIINIVGFGNRTPKTRIAISLCRNDGKPVTRLDRPDLCVLCTVHTISQPLLRNFQLAGPGL